jgi:hypothetical protein
MEWIDTPESSNIARFSYDEVSHVLKVEFKNGSVYAYYDVPEQLFNSMLHAPSKGQYLAQQVKGSYRYARA